MTLVDWKQLEITQVILQEFRARIEEQKSLLCQTAGKDPLTDAWRRGVIDAYSDVVYIELDGESAFD